MEYKPGMLTSLFSKDEKESSSVASLFADVPVAKEHVLPTFVSSSEWNEARAKKAGKTAEEGPLSKAAKKVIKSTTKKAKRLALQDKKARERKEKMAETQEEKDAKLPRTVFIGNVSTKTTLKGMQKFVKALNVRIESVRFRSSPIDQKFFNRKKSGFIMGQFDQSAVQVQNCYVVLREEKDVDTVVKELNGKELDGCVLRTDRCGNEAEGQINRKKAVFVGNLPLHIKDEELRKVFEPVGEITSIRLVRDRVTKIGKGFGFVQFAERASVKAALELGGTDVNGRWIRVTKVLTDESRKLEKHRADEAWEAYQEKEMKKRMKLKARVKSGKFKKDLYKQIREGEGPRRSKNTSGGNMEKGKGKGKGRSLGEGFGSWSKGKGKGKGKGGK